MADFGMFGLGERPAVQDLNASQKAQQLQFNAVPLNMVMRPQHSSFKAAGAALEDVSSTLGSIIPAINKWTEEQKKIEFMEGKLAAAQGKGLDQIHEVGGKLATSGYKVFKAEAAANEFLASARMAIAGEDAALSPVQYRSKLSEQYKSTLKQVDSTDPYVMQVLDAQTDKIFGTLAQEQIIQHSKYIENQTADAASKYLVSALNSPDTKEDVIRAFITSDMSGLPEARKKQVLMDTFQALASGGRGTEDALNKYKRAAKLPVFTPSGKAVGTDGLTVDTVQPVVRFLESADEQFFSDGSVKEGVTKDGKKTGAFGIMQIQAGAASDMAKRLGVPFDLNRLKTDKDYNEMLGTEYLRYLYSRYGTWDKTLAAYNHGMGNMSKLLQEHPEDWRDFLPSETKDYLTRAEEKLGVLNPAMNAGYDSKNFIKAAMAQGFTIEEAAKLQALDQRARSEASNRFNIDYIKQEDAIVSGVRSGDDTIQGALEKIEAMGNSMNLTDNQMNSLASKVLAADNVREKLALKTAEVDKAIGTGTVNQLPQSGIQLATDRVNAQIREEVAGYAADAARKGVQVTEQQAEELQMQKFAQYVAKNNNVIDTRYSEAMEAAPSQEVWMKDGKLNPIMAREYTRYRFLREAGGDALADAYAGSAAEFYKHALMYDAGGNIQDALSAAKQWQTQMQASGDKAVFKNIISDEDVQKEIDRAADGLDSIWPSYEGREKYSGVLQRYDSETEAMKNSPVLKSAVRGMAEAIRLRDPGHPNPAREAVNNVLKGKVDFALGNVLVTTGTTTIAEDAGLKGYESTGAVELGISLYIQKHWPEVFKAKWPVKEFDKAKLLLPLGIGSVYAIGHGISKASSREIPKGLITYDYQNKQVLYYPEQESDGWFSTRVLSSIPLAIPISAVGTEFMQTHASWRDNIAGAFAKLKAKAAPVTDYTEFDIDTSFK